MAVPRTSLSSDFLIFTLLTRKQRKQKSKDKITNVMQLIIKPVFFFFFAQRNS